MSRDLHGWQIFRLAHARERDLEFALTHKALFHVLEQNCFILGPRLIGASKAGFHRPHALEFNPNFPQGWLRDSRGDKNSLWSLLQTALLRRV